MSMKAGAVGTAGRAAGLAIAVLCAAGIAAAADTALELAKGAEFTFGIQSDNHGACPYNTIQFAKVDQWVKEYGTSVIIGVGDHTNDPSNSFIPFMQTDPYWHNFFYPGTGDHDNECYGEDEDDWGAGGAIFYEVDLYSRPEVAIRPNGAEYYAQIAVGDWTIHVVAVHFPDQPMDPNVAFPEDSRQFMIDTLQSITHGPKDIVICTAHSIYGYWVHHLSTARQQIVMDTADYCFAGTSHNYERYVHPTYGETNGALCLNSGCITGSDCRGFIQCFAFDDPPRVISIFQHSGEQASPQLKIGTKSDARWITKWAYEKIIGQSTGGVSWFEWPMDLYDAYPAGAASPDGAFGPGWNLISVPLAPEDPDAAVVLDGLNQGANDLTNNLYRYDPGTGYRIYPGHFTGVDAGKAYWVRLEEPGTVDMRGTSFPDESDVPLGPGWNMIGPTRTWPVTLSNCKVREYPGGWPVTWSAATTLGWVDGTLYSYDGSYHTVRASGGDDDALRPWKGYWILANQADLVFVVRPGEEPPPPLVIDDVAVGSITPTTATVTWTSLVHSTSQVEFGPTPAYGETTQTNTTLVRNHSVKVAGLPPNAQVHYRVISTSDGYDAGISDDATFTTAYSATVPADGGFESGTLNEWLPWPDTDPIMQVGTQALVGPIDPYAGSYLVYSSYSAVDQNGGIYARVGATPGNTYELHAWSNLYMRKNTEPFPADQDCRQRIGLDPYGGSDATSPNIVWSAWDQRPNKTPPEWRELSAQTVAQGNLLTVFIEFDQHYIEGYMQMVNAFDDISVSEVSP